MSERGSDFSLIRDPEAQEHPAYGSFVGCMRGREYGSEALNDAWAWFRNGWDEAVEEEETAAEDSR